jgi:hypothetical protein
MNHDLPSGIEEESYWYQLICNLGIGMKNKERRWSWFGNGGESEIIMMKNLRDKDNPDPGVINKGTT